jgi:hypothetical protein
MMFGWTVILRRDLAYKDARIQELERQNFELLGRVLTKHNNYAIPPPPESKSASLESPAPVEMVQGFTKEDFISFQIESGLRRADALEMWDEVVRTGQMPWQWERPFASADEVVTE